MNSTQLFLNFADKIEQKEIVSQETAIKMRSYIRRVEDSTPIELFLIVSGIMGALFCTAGFFSLIGHYWDEYPKYIRAIFSVVPSLVGLYFYYRAVFHHPKSRPWIETSSVFLMLMIGASIALVSQTYQMDGDFNTFIKAWAILSLPIFYFARASGITILYLGLISILAVQVSFNFFGFPRFSENANSMWYWFLLLGYLPHYYLSLKKKERAQSIRIVYMSYVVYLSFMVALLVTIKGNYFLWTTVTAAGFYLLGKRFMGENSTIFSRPFQLFSQLSNATIFLALANKDYLRIEFSEDSFIHLFKNSDGLANQYINDVDPNEGKMFYFVLAMLLLTVIYFVYFYFRKHFRNISKLVLFAPAFLVLMMICHAYVFPHWLVVMLVNVYVLFIGLNALITGSENQNIPQMVFAFLLISILFWMRYFDTDWNYIMKGLMFVAIGGVFFLINLTQRSKLERIERNKTRRDDY